MSNMKIRFGDCSPVIQELILRYCEVLDIPLFQAMEILNTNKTALFLLTNCKSGICLHEIDEVVQVFIKITLCREDSMEKIMYPINNSDKELLKQYYNIEL